MQHVERIRQVGESAIDDTKQAFYRSNKWLLSPPKKPSGIVRTLCQTFRPIIGESYPRLEYIVSPMTLFGTIWAIAMAAMSMVIFRMAMRPAPHGKRDAVLLVIVCSAIVYHLTWAVYRWQECLLKPVMPLLARFA